MHNPLSGDVVLKVELNIDASLWPNMLQRNAWKFLNGNKMICVYLSQSIDLT